MKELFEEYVSRHGSLPLLRAIRDALESSRKRHSYSFLDEGVVREITELEMVGKLVTGLEELKRSNENGVPFATWIDSLPVDKEMSAQING